MEKAEKTHLMTKELIVIEGPTAVGKTSLSISLAQNLNTEIISADSRQIYRELNIGTAVPTQQELTKVKHHFIQNKSIHDYYNASMYEQEVNSLLEDLFRHYNKVILCGGSGLYIDAVCKGIDDLPEMDPEVRNKVQKQLDENGIESLREDLLKLDPQSFETIDLDNPKRIQKALEISLITGKPYSSFLTSPRKKRDYLIKKIALNMDREDLYERINTRVLDMIDRGLIEEARELHKFRNINALNTVGYKEIFEHFDGAKSLEEAIVKIQSNTRKYARKQLTWFRKDKDTHWFDPADTSGILEFIFAED
ncbi:MAG: tRNA (adenosine(37)-N6)-dimethylallyltransferase MiaA [Bacteroidales bacterium]|nr:tRNA (adenosine(37)-N6)-dimethylallyltransferase MiaA [Bacteroidales bacterium]